MKTTVNENLKISAGTRQIVECVASLNDNYLQTVNALNTAFGSNEESVRILMKEYLPAFLELQKVLKGFIAESVANNIEREEVNEI